MKVTKTKVNLKKGKSTTIKASVQKKGSGKLASHRKLAYESSNTNVATVSAKGKITGKAKGTCKIYVYSQSGLFKTVNVTVK